MKTALNMIAVQLCEERAYINTLCFIIMNV